MVLPGPDLVLPELALVVLIGASGAGKSTFAAQHFAPQEVLTPGPPPGPGLDRAALPDRSTLLERAADRLTQGRLTVVDDLLLRPADRRALVALARAQHVWPVAIVLDLPRPVIEARQAARALESATPPEPEAEGRLTEPTAEPSADQVAELRRTLGGLGKEGFRQVWVLRGEAEVAAARVTRRALPTDLRHRTGPFDLIGDVHGCLTELRELLTRLGYGADGLTPPPGRSAVFVGDLVDRGPDSAGVLRLVMGMVAAGTALCVPGNHDAKLLRALGGKAVKPLHGLDDTLRQLEAAGEGFCAGVRDFLGGLPGHLVLDGGRLVVAHAGLPEAYHGRQGGVVRSFALYGDVDGSQDEYGLPVRRDWAADYRGAALVVYGHTPVAEPRWIANTVDIDTGCVFGGHLSALRYPERELICVAARRPYAVPRRPLAATPGP